MKTHTFSIVVGTAACNGGLQRRPATAVPWSKDSMRFCKQRDRYSCGAVALLNVDKFFGRRATYRDMPKYRKLVNCVNTHGTRHSDMTRVLGRASRRGWKHAKRFLDERNCILISTKWRNGGGHYYLMLIHNYDIQIVNFFSDLSTFSISSQRASRLLKRAKRTWYINKEIL